MLQLNIYRGINTVIALISGLVLTFLFVQTATARTNRPRSMKMSNFVRVDMACPPTATGISAAFPLIEMPLNILNEERLLWYEDNVFNDDFMNAYEFRSIAGRYVCYPTGGLNPVRLKETVFPPAMGTFYKSIIQQSNTGVFSDLELRESLDCLGISGKGLVGTDLTKMLNLPFKSSRQSTLKKDYEDIEGMTFNVQDKAKFDVMFSDPDADINDDLMAGYFETFMNPGNIALKANFVFGKTIDGSASAMATPFNRSAASNLKVTTTSIDMQPFCTGPVEMSYATTSTRRTTRSAVRVRRTTGAQGFETSTTHKIQIQGWPYAGSKGWCELSSFSEIGELPSSGTGTHSSSPGPITSGTAGPKPATMIFLTPLSAIDEGLASLAVRKEMIRALRTRWIFTEKPSPTFVTPVHSSNVTRALLRSTPALWDYLAHNNSMEALKQVNGYESVGPVPRARMFRDYSTVVGHLMSPSSLNPSMVKLPDYNEGSYFFPYDRKADNYYATAVYKSWKNLFNNEILSKLLVPALRTKLENKKINTVTRAISTAIFAGYCEDTKFKAGGPGSILFENHKNQLLELYKPDTEVKIRQKYGIDFMSLKGKFTDLEWIANCIEPYPPSTGGGVPSTILTGTPTLLASAELDRCGLAPILYPFSPMRNSQQGKRLLQFVKGAAATTIGTSTIPATLGISSMAGLPFTSAAPKTYVIDVDPSSAKKLKEFCEAFFNNNMTSLPTGVSSTSVTTWTDVEATAAINSTTESIKLLGHYKFQLIFKEACNLITTRIMEHHNMGDNEIALVVERNTGTRFRPVYTLEPAPSASGGIPGTDSPASLFCSIFPPANNFLEHQFSGRSGNSPNLLKKRKKKFFTALKKSLLHEPKTSPQRYFDKYLDGEFIKEAPGNNIPWDVHTFVRRTKELAIKLGQIVSFKKADGTDFVATSRRDY